MNKRKIRHTFQKWLGEWDTVLIGYKAKQTSGPQIIKITDLNCGQRYLRTASLFSFHLSCDVILLWARLYCPSNFNHFVSFCLRNMLLKWI